MAMILARVLVVILALTASLNALADKNTIGWVEKIHLYPGKLIIKAKIDTGAKTSSLNCACNDIFMRDGAEWLRFIISDDKGNSQQYEKEIQRIAKVRRHFGESQERGVINIDICLAGKRKTIQATVIDREGFNYQLLIGRSAIAGDFLVDPGKAFLGKPNCD